MQSRKHSFLEALLNTSTGFLTSLLTQWVVFPWFAFYPSLHENLTITAIFTTVSIARSYAWRRVFNHLQTKGML